MKYYPREKYLKKIRLFYHDTDIIKVITGLRRCGKSSLLQTIREELLEGGVNPDSIIYLDLEKRGYRSIKTADQLESLIESFPKQKGITYLFIDEVQNVDGFEEIVNGYRNEGNYSIFITGSNSYLLGGELVTKLTGRYIEFEMFVLGFDEYIGMKKFYKLPLKSLDEEMNEYIVHGGFPKATLMAEPEKKRLYTEAVVAEIIKKDIYKRGKIRNRGVFELVMNFLFGNFGSTFSIKSLKEALDKEGNKISRKTLTHYINLLVEAKVLYECSRFDLKSKKSLQGEKKYYLGDTSFYFASRTDGRINYGPALENAVYIYARGSGYAVSVGRIGDFECDFILRNNEADYAYVQVAFSIMDRATEEREYRPLENIRYSYPKYLLTMDKFLQKRNGIIHENLAEFIGNGRTF